VTALTGVDPAVAAAAARRDGWMCVCCGEPIAGRPHSAGLRSEHGPADDLRNVLTFLGLGINPLDPDDHHARIDSRVDPNDEARGLTVRGWQNPADVSVMLGDSGALVWLTDDGEYSLAPPDWPVAS
jgi:hypothetical protein